MIEHWDSAPKCWGRRACADRVAGVVLMVDAALCGAVEQRFVPLWLTTVFAPDVSRAFDELGVGQAERYFANAGRAPRTGERAGRRGDVLQLQPSGRRGRDPRGVGALHAAPAARRPARRCAAQAWRALAGVDGDVVEEAAGLLGRAAAAACERPEGRPLFAGYASLPWPDDPHLRLWHAHYLLREFRGDGHIAVLASEGLTGLEALQLHIAFVPAVGPVFRATRGWSDDQWAASLETLQGRGWLTTDDELTLTPAGRRYREEIEGRTDARNVPAYEAVGDEGARRLLEVGAAIASALLADSGSPFPGLIPDG